MFLNKILIKISFNVFYVIKVSIFLVGIAGLCIEKF